MFVFYLLYKTLSFKRKYYNKSKNSLYYKCKQNTHKKICYIINYLQMYYNIIRLNESVLK